MINTLAVKCLYSYLMHWMLAEQAVLWMTETLGVAAPQLGVCYEPG